MSARNNLRQLISQLQKPYITHNRIEVSRKALLHNLDLFGRLSGLTVIPVLKGNAYGHGIEQVAKALRQQKLSYLAVDGYFEALRIREVTKQPVLIMGAILPENYRRLNYDNFAFVVHDPDSIQALGQTRKHIKVHLEINSGMNRYGVKPEEAVQLTKLILSYPRLELEGLMSHLADSDGSDPATVDQAVVQFDNCVASILATGAKPTLFHIAQSAGSLKAKSAYANAMRLGIGLYGINPFLKNHTLNRRLHDLQPALRLTSTITKIIELNKGDRVSYNYTFTAPHKMRIGILPLGYYEGVNRSLSNTGTVKIGKHQAKVVGRVCMNHTMISLDKTRARVGDTVIVYSNNPSDLNSIDNVARLYGLFNYNLLTALSSDVRRILVN